VHREVAEVGPGRSTLRLELDPLAEEVGGSSRDPQQPAVSMIRCKVLFIYLCIGFFPGYNALLLEHIGNLREHCGTSGEDSGLFS
jgi:hypothetical protein